MEYEIINGIKHIKFDWVVQVPNKSYGDNLFDALKNNKAVIIKFKAVRRFWQSYFKFQIICYIPETNAEQFSNY